jgi:hypothetical protein
MNEYRFSDKLLHGSRQPRLYFLKGSSFKKFEGKDVSGFVVVKTANFEKNGKWSGTDFTLILAKHVQPFEMISPMHGVWGDQWGTWQEAEEKTGVPVALLKEIVPREYPRTARRWNSVEDFLMEEEEKDSEGELIVISFGGATRKAAANGFWTEPKGKKTSDGRYVEIRPGQKGWYEPIVPEGCQHVSTRRTPGHGGGYYAIEILVSGSYKEPKQDSDSISQDSEPFGQKLGDLLT